MATRITFGSVKNSIARVLSMNTTDTRVAEYTSRAQERLLHKGKWVGTFGRFRVCVTDSCLTWPREIETIEAAAHCGHALTLRNGWYEFLGNGTHVAGECCGFANQLVDREDACAFDDIVGTGKKLALYADNASDAGKQVLVRYYKSDGNKCYSTVGGLTVEGEYLTLVAPVNYVYSTYEVLPGGFYDVVKPVTLRMVRVFQYTVAGGALKPIAYYEPDETNPVYRRSILPGGSGTCCSDAESQDTCATHSVDIVGKFRHRAVSKDDDALIIQSGEALRMMVQAIRKEEDSMFQDATMYEARAEKILDDQLKHWNGSGVVSPIKVVGCSTFGGNIPQLV